VVKNKSLKKTQEKEHGGKKAILDLATCFALKGLTGMTKISIRGERRNRRPGGMTSASLESVYIDGKNNNWKGVSSRRQDRCPVANKAGREKS